MRSSITAFFVLTGVACLPVLVIAGVVFPLNSDVACIRDGVFNLHPLVIDLAIIVMFVSTLTLTPWAIKRVFFPTGAWFSPILAANGLLSLILGITGFFAIHLLSLTMGINTIDVTKLLEGDVPFPTEYLLSARYFLWLPAIFVIGLWYASKTWRYRTRYLAVALFSEALLLFLLLLSFCAPTFKLGCVLA